MLSYTFQITKKIIFEVNNNQYFATSCAEFNQPKTDFCTCGQCQDELLPKGKAREFWSKWDVKHLSQLTPSEEEELSKDIEELKASYNWCLGCGFTDQKKLSMQELKKQGE